MLACVSETVVSALHRVLSDDWKRSTDLAINIIYIFFCFSSFARFHAVIVHFKIGSMCMSLVEHELKKYDLWKQELNDKKSAGIRNNFFLLGFRNLFIIIQLDSSNK